MVPAEAGVTCLGDSIVLCNNSPLVYRPVSRCEAMQLWPADGAGQGKSCRPARTRAETKIVCPTPTGEDTACCTPSSQPEPHLGCTSWVPAGSHTVCSHPSGRPSPCSPWSKKSRPWCLTVCQTAHLGWAPAEAPPQGLCDMAFRATWHAAILPGRHLEPLQAGPALLDSRPDRPWPFRHACDRLPSRLHDIGSTWF